MEKLEIIVDKQEKVLDLLCKSGFSYNTACKLLRNKDVKVDESRIKENILVQKGQKVVIFYEKTAKNQLFDIIYEDENIFVIDKKAGIEVEGEGGLVEQIPNAIAVHRLDRNTEGLMLTAKNEKAKEILLKSFKNRTITKKYLAEVVGKTNFKGEIYTAYLEKDSKNSFVKIYDKNGKNRMEIKTSFKTLRSNPSSSLVECELITGKTHQIRAHLAFLGHPIIGDGKYGKNEDNKKFKKSRQQLFCNYIKIDGLDFPLDYLNGKIFKR